MSREQHTLTLSYNRAERSKYPYRASCSCGNWTQFSPKDQDAARADHREHMLAYLGPEVTDAAQS
jgi:hypothetical protein